MTTFAKYPDTVQSLVDCINGREVTVETMKTALQRNRADVIGMQFWELRTDGEK
jgi:hypothetical protein